MPYWVKTSDCSLQRVSLGLKHEPRNTDAQSIRHSSSGSPKDGKLPGIYFLYVSV
jgi:hypothetical protein